MSRIIPAELETQVIEERRFSNIHVLVELVQMVALVTDGFLQGTEPREFELVMYGRGVRIRERKK